MRHKVLLRLQLRVDRLSDSEGEFGDPLKVEEKISKSQAFQVQYQTSAVSFAERCQMKPYPDVSQNHRQGEEEQTQQGTPAACPNAAFVHLAVTGFDPEPGSIRFANPTGASGLTAPKRIHERTSSVPAPLAGKVAARHADPHRGRLPILRGLVCFQRVGRPAALTYRNSGKLGTTEVRSSPRVEFNS